jgi:thioredoxin-related protein
MFYKIRYFFTILLILFFSNFSCKENNNEKVTARGMESATKWEKLNTGLENIKKLKKPAMMFFYTDWCVYCKKMNSEVFSDPEVSLYLNENFISIRVNPEKENDTIEVMGDKITASKLMELTGSNGFPTTLFWDKTKKPVTTVPGFIEKEKFLQILKYLKDECYENKISINDYMKNPDLCRKKN